MDIKQHTAQDFFVAFHHRTQKEDKGFYFALDDIQVGYRDKISADKTPLANKKQSASVPISDLKNNANEDILILDTKPDEPLTVNS